MNDNQFILKIVKTLDLGGIIEGPQQVTGGLTHKMYKVFTNKGKYIIKLLNPNIMKRPTAFNHFKNADLYEDILKEYNTKAIYSLKYNNQKMQEIDGQFFYIYEWYEGKSLNNNEIKKYHCIEIAKVLADIHNIDLVKKEYKEHKKNIDFQYYINIAKKENLPIYNLMYKNLEILNRSMDNGNKAISRLPNYYSICHNDMDPKNVLWIDKDYRIIDLECLGYSNPYLELYELALCWSGYEECNIQYDLLKAFLKSYFSHSKLEKNIDWESIYDANNGRLEWLEFNLKRSFMIECDTKEEQALGINEVLETIKHVEYYEKEKNTILKNIKEILDI